MKPIVKSHLAVVLAFPIALLLSMPTFAPLSAAAQQESTPPPTYASPASGEHMDQPETNSQMESFRHSESVKSIARHVNLSTETTARIFEILNSAIIIGSIAWFVLRFVPKAFRKRNDALQQQLVEARVAATDASERLAVIEERLSKLGIEIEAIREHTERESAEDEKRIQNSLEAEKERIIAAAEQEIQAAGAAAQRDLKKFAAQLAVNRARQEIRISLDDDRALIRSFGESLNGDRN
ncbi:MAG: ATPase [Silvibacterium sp.]|nr:ATPase [Silvibacterium sp.]